MNAEDMKIVDKLTKGKELDAVAQQEEELAANEPAITARMTHALEGNKRQLLKAATPEDVPETKEGYIARLRRSIKNLEFDQGNPELTNDAKLKITSQIRELDQELKSLGVTMED